MKDGAKMFEKGGTSHDLDPEAGVATNSPVITAVAETFQADRTVVLSDRRALAIGTLSRPCEVLDLASARATPAGAGNHRSTGSHPVTRRSARAIRAGYPELDGGYCTPRSTLPVAC